MNADQVIKNFERAQLPIKLAYDPDQPRDEMGRFGSGGGGGKDDKESGGKGDLQNTKNLSSSDLMKAVPELPHAAAEYIKIVNANAGGKDVIHLPRTGQIPHAAMKKLREIYAGRKVETFDLRASAPGERFQTKSQKAMSDVMFGKKLSFADEVIKNFERAQLPIKLAYDPDQPRDEQGRFGSGGGGGEKEEGNKGTFDKPDFSKVATFAPAPRGGMNPGNGYRDSPGHRWTGGTGLMDHRLMHSFKLHTETGLPELVARAVTERNRSAPSGKMFIPKVSEKVTEAMVAKIKEHFSDVKYEEFNPDLVITFGKFEKPGGRK